MKKLVFNLMMATLIVGVSFANAKIHRTHKASSPRTFTGEIFDSQCAMNNSHAPMEKMHKMGNDSKMCTQECVKMGGKYVLQNTAKKITYQLDDQDKPKEFAGQKVKVTGTYDKATKTIHVENIKAAF